MFDPWLPLPWLRFPFRLAASETRGQSLKAGAATSNITPPIGAPIVGGHLPVPSTHVHDELHARCLVLDDGQTKLALVTCDVVGLHRLVCDEAKQLIQKEAGIPPSHVLISATHTHSAASVQGRTASSTPTPSTTIRSSSSSGSPTACGGP